ncbi:DUF222 domain-containing protein [Amycolatopsis anabasis]|uniref:DUF222 domain-containing protein n=1 Tax=Amycolatopsis anabasis TaxID=1840409 RepID=UPI00131ADA0C|nr:DUF222 domain-containing protein [Amycolatopsis anabasis]
MIDYDKFLGPDPTPPGWDINELLDVDVGTCDAVDSLQLARAVTEVQSMLEAVRLRAIEQFARQRPEDAAAGVPDTLACELKVSVPKAGSDLALAHALIHRLPETLGALAKGRLDPARAAQIERATTVLSLEKAHEVETRIFPRVLERTPRQLYDTVRWAVLKVDPDGADERCRSRKAERRTAVAHREDGMSWFHAFLPSHDVLAMAQRIDSIAREVAGPDEPRTRKQLRADVLRDLVLGKNASTVTTNVYVTMNASTLLGLDNLPGELRGYGPLPAQRLRELAFDLKAVWSGVLVDDQGYAKKLAARRYRPSRQLKELANLRNRYCSYTACNRTAEKCDFEHRIPHNKDGTTDEHIRDPFCRRHHRFAQSPFWHVTKNQHGEILWTSDLGRTYTNTPEPITDPATPEPPPPH